MPNVSSLFNRHYFARPDFVDGTTEFHEMCRASLAGATSILEIGAGPSNATTKYLSSLAPVVGLDVSAEVLENAFVSDARLFDGIVIPFPAASFDGCVSNYVLEH